jgi:hypothetical protein
MATNARHNIIAKYVFPIFRQYSGYSNRNTTAVLCMVAAKSTNNINRTVFLFRMKGTDKRHIAIAINCL